MEYTHAANWDDYSEAVLDDRWREGLPDLAAMAREQEITDGETPLGFRTSSDGGNALEITLDTVLADENSYTYVLTVTSLEDELYVYPPTVRACLEPNQFGFIFNPESLTWTLDPDFVSTGDAPTPQSPPERTALVMWVDPALRVNDQYQRAAYKLQEWQSARELRLASTIVCGVAGVLLMIYLCCGAGHKKGVDGISLNWFHRIPGTCCCSSCSWGAWARWARELPYPWVLICTRPCICS